MIVLIAPEQDIAHEIKTLNQLFEAGLEYYHLRKPHKNYEEYCTYLNQIDEKYQSKIVVHYHHELIQEYKLRGLHFQEQKRKNIIEKKVKIESIKTNINISISSSFHALEELEECKTEFDYYLLSPVFSSISKAGYEGKGFDVNHINKRIVGMGGVTTENLNEFTKLGFKGVGVLGGVWNSKDPVSNFKKMKKYFKQIKL